MFLNQQGRPSDPHPFSPVINGNAIICLIQWAAQVKDSVYTSSQEKK